MSGEADGRALAERFRAEQGLGDQPLSDLVTLIETTQGIDVAVLEAGDNEHGMTVRDPARDVVMMAVSRTRVPFRQRSSLAHELGHLLAGDYKRARWTGDWSGRRPAEVRADAFARHLLVPLKALTSLAKRGNVTEADLSSLVQQYQASPVMVAIQLHHAHAINAKTKDAWKAITAPALAARHGWTDQYQALQALSNTRRAPQRLLARATDGYVAGVLSLQAIARLRGVPALAVAEDFVEAGIAPKERTVEWSSADDLGATPVDLSDLDADDDN